MFVVGLPSALHANCQRIPFFIIFFNELEIPFYQLKKYMEALLSYEIQTTLMLVPNFTMQ